MPTSTLYPEYLLTMCYLICQIFEGLVSSISINILYVGELHILRPSPRLLNCGVVPLR